MTSITLSLSDAEMGVLLETMRRAGFATPWGALSCGLVRLAGHLDITVPKDCFTLALRRTLN